MTTQVCDAPPHHTGGEDGAAAQPARWGGVFAMTLCVFALIASEFMPVSLLTPMAADLGVSEGWAGQGIAISGAFAVLTSLSEEDEPRESYSDFAGLASSARQRAARMRRNSSGDASGMATR